MRALANFVLKASWLIIGLFVVATLALGYGLTRLTLDDSTDALQPDESAIVALNDTIEKTFGEVAETAIVLLEGDMYTPAALTEVRALTAATEELPGVVTVTSVGNGSRFEGGDGSLTTEDLLPQTGAITEQHITDLRAFFDTSYIYKDGLLISNNGEFAAMIIELEPEYDTQLFDAALTETVQTNWSGKSYVSGEAVIEATVISSMQRDLPLLTGLAAVLILLFLFLNFRTVQGTVLPLVTVLMGLVWAIGLMGYLGLEMTVLSVIAPVAVMAVGSSFSLHLLGRYYFELSHGESKQDAIRLMLTETGLGVVISGLAISAAMATFLLSELAGVRGLGLETATGVMTCLLGSILFMPAMLNVLPKPKKVIDPEAAGFISGFLHGVARFAARARIGILVVAALLMGVSIWGASRIEVNTNFLDFFPKNSGLRQSTDVVETNFGGASQLRTLVTGDINDPIVVQEMLTFREEIQKIDGVGASQSVATVVRELHQTLTGEESLPETRDTLAQELLLWQLSADDPSDVSGVVTLDGSQALISTTAQIVSSSETRGITQEVQTLADDIFSEGVELEYAGSSIENLLTEDALLHDFVISLTLALILVLVIDSFVRSIRAAAVTMLALIVTIALQYGFLGYLGINLDIATTLLGALAIGVGDYAIHLTVRYMEERPRAGGRDGRSYHLVGTRDSLYRPHTGRGLFPARLRQHSARLTPRYLYGLYRRDRRRRLAHGATRRVPDLFTQPAGQEDRRSANRHWRLDS